MSRTERGSKGPGYEYWSRRHPNSPMEPGKDSKRKTHRYERRQANDEIRDYEDEEES
jgi:hypothetical protein